MIIKKLVFVAIFLACLKTIALCAQAKIKEELLVDAATAGNITEVTRLLDAGASIHGPIRRNESRPRPGCSSNHYSPPLRWAAIRGHKDVAQLLILRGADVNHRVMHYTPIIEAAAAGHTQLVELFIASGADVNAHNDSQQTALHYAAQRGFEEMVRALLQAGAKVATVTKSSQKHLEKFNGQSALHWAAENGRTSIIHLLMDFHADIHCQDNEGYTPLLRAIENRHTETALLLIQRGTARNAQNSSGFTALHCAAQTENLAVVQALISAGVDVTITTHTGLTAFDIAKGKKNAQITEILRANQPTVLILMAAAAPAAAK